ncbi:cell division protein SepF [Dietzia sp.]|uniref:cell division protein SepF n=1 Tax=Dietzia sp. TaxID=1871616 RepID=UPI002FD911C0
MSTFDKVKDFFGMNPNALAEGDEYFDDEYETGEFRAVDPVRDEPLHPEDRVGHAHSRPAYRSDRFAGEYAEDIGAGGYGRLDPEPAPERPRRYRAAAQREPLGGLEPSARTVAPVRGSVALKPEVDEFEDFDDGLVVRPEAALERPRGYADGKSVGENFRAGTPVVLDLSLMAAGDARRMIDFAAGLVFALDGQMGKIADRERTFFMSPAGLDLTEAEKREAANAAFRR